MDNIDQYLLDKIIKSAAHTYPAASIIAAKNNTNQQTWTGRPYYLKEFITRTHAILPKEYQDTFKDKGAVNNPYSPTALTKFIHAFNAPIGVGAGPEWYPPNDPILHY